MNTTQNDCARYRDQLLDEQHGRLDAGSARELQQHLTECANCASLDRQERWLTDLLRTKLTQPRAPKALRERLEAQFAPEQSLANLAAAPVIPLSPPRRPAWKTRAWSAAVAVAAVAAAALIAVRVGVTDPADNGIVREALNDHLRVVYAQNPIEIPSGGIHQVKPWFTGRLDFAPDIAFSGDDDFPLIGGAVGYFIDRKAATFVFKRRLHTISCFVFRTNELAWPSGTPRAIPGGPNAVVTSQKGFHLVLWREDDLGHACVSDVSEPELMTLASKLAQR